MEKKTTQKEYYNGIIAYLNGEETPFTVDEMVDFLNGRIDVLAKKSANKKPTKAQVENEVLKATIVEILTDLGTPVTASAILTDNRIPAGTSLPKITAQLTALVKAGTVIRTEDKRKAFFSVETADEVADEVAE